MDDLPTTDRRTYIKSVGATGVAGLTALAGCSSSSGSNDGSTTTSGSGAQSWRLGTSGPETATHASGVAMANVVSEQSEELSVSAQTTGGTASNPRLISKGDIDVAQSTTWAGKRANTGQKPYGKPVGETITQVIPFMSLEYYLVKRDTEKLADVESVSDIPTDNSISMAFGQRGGTNYFAGLDGFRLSGIDNPQDKYDIQSMSWGQQASSFRNGQLDVILTYGVSREVLTGWAQEVGSTTEVDVVTWEFDEETLANSEHSYVYLETPADLWNQELRVDSIPSVGVSYETVFPASVSEDRAYQFTDLVMNNVQQVRDASSVLSRAGPEFAAEFLLRSPDLPVHPGAAKWYKEQDLWSEDLTTLEEYQS